MTNKPTRITVGGVPEPFNEPWKAAVEELRREHGVELEFRDFLSGTAAINAALKSGEIDVGLPLTEGALKFALEDSSIAIHSFFVTSPLNWGIHVGAASSAFRGLDELREENCRFAISRYGSGSHLMSFILAQQLNFDVARIRFVVVNDIHGAKKALAEDCALVFLWEKGYTSPLVDAGVFRRIGVIPTPWPCFVIALNRDRGESLVLETVLSVVRRRAAEFKRGGERTVEEIQRKYGIKRELVEEWVSEVRYEELGGTPAPVLVRELEEVRRRLEAVGQIKPGTGRRVEDVVMIPRARV